MLSTITVFGRQFSVYALMVALGLIVCMVYCAVTYKKWKENAGTVEIMLLVGCCGAYVGSKILFLITILPQFIADFHYLFTDTSAFLTTYFGGGFVFYGGLYGGIITVLIYCHFNHLDKWEMSKDFMPCVPLFHGFGRIGCFLVGCCYGCETDFLGITYHNSEIAPNDVSLLPVQLIESFVEFILFFVIWRLSQRENSGRLCFCVWLIVYSIVRFILEFFRGDEFRGFVWVLSTSQFIALLSIVFAIFVWEYPKLFHKEKKGEKT